MRIFQHKLNGNYYRLVKSNKGSVNTFLQVDIENKLIINWRDWSNKPEEIKAIISGFENLTEIH
jgi:DNA phosphorothioation-dependent restriction protein DptG|tara:strand:- start:293 stop:484 length:192 start_codon:yes stop_codon:yes gene_type:complete